MNANIRNRLLIILVLVVASVWALWPRTITVRERNPKTGVFYDTTRTRVPLKRGLDLQGGMYLALEVDDSKGVVRTSPRRSIARSRSCAIASTSSACRSRWCRRSATIASSSSFPASTIARAPRRSCRTRPSSQFQITDKTQALEKALARSMRAVKQTGGDDARRGARPTRAKAASPLNLLLGRRQRKGEEGQRRRRTRSTAVGAPGGPFSKLIQPGQMPGQYLVAKNDVPTVQSYLDRKEVQAALPPGKALHWGSEDLSAGNASYATLYLVDARPIITGEYLTDAKPGSDPTEGNLVSFTLNNEGGRRFRTETGKHIGDYMAIVLDDRVMGAPPVIQSAIGTRGQITMRGADLQKTQDLALVLRAGALPVPLKVVESRTIGSSLGADSIRDGIHAGIAGVALVVLIMIFYYRFSGMLAVAALLLYLLFTLALLAGLEATRHAAGARGTRAVDRYRARRERADLRANTRGDGARENRARLHR